MKIRRSQPDATVSARPRIQITGIARLLGISRRTVYYRLHHGLFSLDGIPVIETAKGNYYDMEAVFKKVFPSADGNAIAQMMLDFRQENGRYAL